MGHPSNVSFLRIGAWATGRAALFPELFPIPESGRDVDRQRESELMREHADLATVVGFVGKHVAQHFHANRPRLRPAVSVKLFDPARIIAECFSEHFGAASGAFGQCGAGLLRRAVGAIELARNFQVRGGQPDPFGADVVHVGEDRGDGAGLAGRFGAPGARVEMFDEHLIHALVGGKDLCRGPAELGVILLTRSHGILLLPIILPTGGRLKVIQQVFSRNCGKTLTAQESPE